MHAKIKDGVIDKYPYTFGDLQAENPYTNYNGASDVAAIFPTTEAATIYGYELVDVSVSDAPSFDPRNQSIEQTPPELINEDWVVGWNVVAKKSDELAAETLTQSGAVRVQRNELLTKSDWTQLPDSTADKQAWATYRQALRDVTLQSGFPWDIQWPNAPQA